MKKFLTMIVIAGMASLYACGGSTENTEAEGTDTTATAPAPEAAPDTVPAATPDSTAADTTK